MAYSAPQALILKLLKGTTLSPKYPTWNLMMKNIYSLGSGKLESNDFQLNILYEDDITGNSINYLPEASFPIRYFFMYLVWITLILKGIANRTDTLTLSTGLLL